MASLSWQGRSPEVFLLQLIELSWYYILSLRVGRELGAIPTCLNDSKPRSPPEDVRQTLLEKANLKFLA